MRTFGFRRPSIAEANCLTELQISQRYEWRLTRTIKSGMIVAIKGHKLYSECQQMCSCIWPYTVTGGAVPHLLFTGRQTDHTV